MADRIKCYGCGHSVLLEAIVYDFEPECPNCGRTFPEGQIASAYDPHNAYSVDGQKVGRMCDCEDYPCCGH